jgi:hypothetical protein
VARKPEEHLRKWERRRDYIQNEIDRANTRAALAAKRIAELSEPYKTAKAAVSRWELRVRPVSADSERDD